MFHCDILKGGGVRDLNLKWGNKDAWDHDRYYNTIICPSSPSPNPLYIHVLNISSLLKVIDIKMKRTHYTQG